MMAQKKQERYSEEEFRAKKEAYITRKAELTPEEAEKIFPLYYELQDRKSENNKRAWTNGRKGKEPGTTEAQYEDILNDFLDTNKANNQLDKEYLKKFQKVLSNKKIYLILKAEISFNRHMLKIMQKQKEELLKEKDLKIKRITPILIVMSTRTRNKIV